MRAHRERDLNLEGAADLWRLDAGAPGGISLFLPWDGSWPAARPGRSRSSSAGAA